MKLPIRNRIEAGQALAEALSHYRDEKRILVLGLPRGGVPVACEVARKLNAELDVMLVRKLGIPGHKEVAMGAIASGGIRVLNEDILSSLAISQESIEEVATEELQELERREQAFRGDRPLPSIKGRCIILVDDGVATGATMRAAMQALHKQNAERVVVAVPVAPAETVEKFRSEADDIICLATPEPFIAVGNWYETFDQVSGDEVKKQLNQAWS